MEVVLPFFLSVLSCFFTNAWAQSLRYKWPTGICYNTKISGYVRDVGVGCRTDTKSKKV